MRNGLFLFQSKLGWVRGEKMITETEEVSESNLFVSTISTAPINTVCRPFPICSQLLIPVFLQSQASNHFGN